MPLETYLEQDELHVVNPPHWGARLVGCLFLGFGAVCLALIAVDTWRKVVAGESGAITHALVSVLIILVMCGLPGLLFGFHTNHVRFNRRQNEMHSTASFVLFWFNRRRSLEPWTVVKLRHRAEIRKSQNGGNRRTVYYLDLLLADDHGQFEVVDSVLEQQESNALSVAREIAAYLQIRLDDKAHLD